MPEQLRQNRTYILMFILNLAVLIGVIYLLRRPEPRVIAITTPAPYATATVALIQVQVNGAVLQPGVYKLPATSRVSSALESAGGARPDADLNAVNLARKLNDGEAVVVPTRKVVAPTFTVSSAASPSPLAARAPHDPVNLNTATVEELDKLPGIGPALAQRIVDYRNQNGPFKKVEEVKNVKGIGDALFDELKDLITVE